jgi:hypothetical protein
MRGRGQLVVAVVVVSAAVLAALALERGVGVRALATGPPPAAPSGAWFCPHGGGKDWQRTLEIANPGSEDVRIRVTTLSESRPGEPEEYDVDPGAELLLPAESPSRASASMVEYFGGWVAAGWVSRAGGGEGGVAAEPCSPTAGRSWLLPDGSTQLAEDATGGRAQKQLQSWVVVMNPFAADAVFSLTLYADKDAPVRAGEWTNVVLKPFRTRAFYLNEQRLGYATVSTSVEAKVGRVVASSLGVSELGGVRSSVGQPAPPADAVLPGGFDQGRTELVVMNPTAGDVQATGVLLGREEPVPVGQRDEGRAGTESAQTYPLSTDGPSALDLHVPTGAAVVRRTFGPVSDQGATGPGVPSRAWVVLPAVAGRPSHAGIVVANPGSEPVDIELSYLPSGAEPPPEPITVRVPGLRAVAVPSEFVQARPLGAILAVSTDGRFVPAAASSSLGREGYATYAVSLGVPIPDTWVPSGP